MIRTEWRHDHRIIRWTVTAAGVGYYAFIIIPKVFR